MFGDKGLGRKTGKKASAGGEKYFDDFL